MYCLCVNVYCHRVTTQLQLTNISYHIIRHSFICKFVGQYSKDRSSCKDSVGSSKDEDDKMAAEGNKWSRVSCVIKEA